METLHLYNLSSLCRACLSITENMKNLFAAENDSIFNMFVVLANFEVKKADTLPGYLCSNCTEKLSISYEFQNQCKKTEELLQQYLSSDPNFKTIDASQNNAIFDEPDPVSENLEEEEEEEENALEPEEPTKEEEEKAHGVKHKHKQKMRLKQFSYDEVTLAIEEKKRKFFENRNCIKCNFHGSNSRALSIHISHVHKELKDRWCSFCNKEVDNIQEHSKLHGNEDLKCQFCSKVLTSKSHLTEHLRSHASERPFKCDACDKCFISLRHLKIHFRVHTNEKPYKCKFCTKSFSQHNSLKVHVRLHHKDEEESEPSSTVFTCAMCCCNFGSKSDLELHSCSNDLADNRLTTQQQNVEQMRQNFCNKCNRKVRSLTYHMEQHHKEGEAYNSNSDCLLCTVCGKQFKTASKLAVHMRVHTGDAPYQCTYCERRLTTRNHLVMHERIHTGERPHVCNICKKAFSQKSVLNTHMKLHTGRPEVCAICSQRFCRPAELRLHMRKHTGEKPYACTECPQSFIQRSHLVEHLKIHSNDRPYQCSYCERAFRQSSSLKSHVQIHLGHKPYRCSQCSYASRQSYSLTQHMKQHANDAPRPEKPHLCLICQKGYTTLAMLTSHAASAHGVCYAT